MDDNLKDKNQSFHKNLKFKYFANLDFFLLACWRLCH